MRPPSVMRIVLFGVSGSIGTAIAAELRERGHEVTGVSRSGTTSVAGVRAVAADASDAARVAELAVGADAVITATGPRHDGSESPDTLAATTRALIEGVRKSGVRRLVIVGGAGSLIDPDGRRHVDNPTSPTQSSPSPWRTRPSSTSTVRSPTWTGPTSRPPPRSSEANAPAPTAPAATSCWPTPTGSAG
jgi:putative NADH-flavin reductase